MLLKHQVVKLMSSPSQISEMGICVSLIMEHPVMSPHTISAVIFGVFTNRMSLDLRLNTKIEPLSQKPDSTSLTILMRPTMTKSDKLESYFEQNEDGGEKL